MKGMVYGCCTNPWYMAIFTVIITYFDNNIITITQIVTEILKHVKTAILLIE